MISSSLARSKAFLEEEVQPLVEQFLAERGLVLSSEKTRVTHIEDGFDFLGAHVRKYRGKLLCTPAKKNVHAFLDTIRGIVKRHKQAITGNLIMQLNPVIRGWAQYHQHGASKRTFAKVDHHIFTLLWQWARRRHPRKSRHWIREQVLPIRRREQLGVLWPRHACQWDTTVTCACSAPPVCRFVGTRRSREKPIRMIPSGSPTLKPVRAYVWRTICEGQRQLLRLWKEQDGLCVVCHQRITHLTGWHSHHLVWRTHGGSDRAENRVLLHPNCHAQVHSQGLTVVKPRPQSGVRKA